MTTQIRPIGGGSWTTINKKDKGGSPKKDDVASAITQLPGQKNQTCLALNLWMNSAGTGEASKTSTEMLKACGLQAQEI